MTTHEERKNEARAASVGTSFWQQLWLIAVSGRWLYPLLGVFGLMLVSAVTEPTYSLVAGVLCIPAAAIWPAMLWHKEAPAQRLYHWSLPVPRPAHDLMRVGVGLIFLVAICALMGAAGAIADGSMRYFATPPQWAGFIFVPVATYLLMTPLALWSDYRETRFALGGLLLLLLFGAVAGELGLPWFGAALTSLLSAGRWSVAEMLTGGVDAMYHGRSGAVADASIDWLAAPALWAATGIAVTVAAATFRPDDLRRRLGRGASLESVRRS